MLKLSVQLSGDALSAKLRFENFTASEWLSVWMGASGKEAPLKLKNYLIGQSIVKELIREENLKYICESLSELASGAKNFADQTVEDLDHIRRTIESAQSIPVAEGFEPTHEEPQGLTFLRSYLSNAEALVDLRRKVDTWGFGGIRESINPAYWVSSGETVLSFQSTTKGIPGRTVLGEEISFQKVNERLPPIGKSLFLKGRKVLAVCEGALILEEGQIKVLGADSLPTCQIVIAEDKMSANLVLGGNYLNDWTVTMDMVESAMRQQSVLCMVPVEQLQTALNKFNENHLPMTLMVAQGQVPTLGKEGHLHMLVNPEPEAPIPGLDGSIDFKNFSFFRTVKKDTKLAEVRAPEQGEPGMNVHGVAVAPKAVKPFSAKLGENTRLDGIAPLFMVANCSGRLAVKFGIPEVVEVLDVVGDVSLKTGNIDFPGAVKVAGDVHNHMQIHSVGDIEIDGTVENSVIESDGAIVIRGGVNGLGTGMIKSRLSSVTIGYLHNQRIESHSHIAVYNEILNSELFARKTISMRFGKYSVMGSTLLAGEGMDLFNVGSEAGSKSILEVGRDFEVQSQMSQKQAKLTAHLQDLDFLADMDDQLSRILKIRKNSDEDAFMHKRTLGAMQNLERWISELRTELIELGKRLYNSNPVEIIIRGIIYPGTMLKYRDEVLVVPILTSHRKWIFKPNGPMPPPEGIPS